MKGLRLAGWALLFVGAALFGVVQLRFERPVQAKPAVDLQITPLVGMAPVDVRIRIKVDRDVKNRGIFVQANSVTFNRSSFIQMDGADSPKFYEIVYKGMPCGDYIFVVDVLNNDGKVWVHVEKVAVYRGMLCDEPPPPVSLDSGSLSVRRPDVGLWAGAGWPELHL